MHVLKYMYLHMHTQLGLANVFTNAVKILAVSKSLKFIYICLSLGIQ